MHSKNKLAGTSFFQNLDLQGPGRVSPGGSSRAAPSTLFAACSEASGGFNCVSKVLLKSQCKKYIWHLEAENQTTPWQGVHFFSNTVLQKS